MVELLGRRWSPQQISRHLRLRFPDERGKRMCHESFYEALYRPGSAYLRPSKLASHRRSPLGRGRDHRRAQISNERRRPRSQQPMLTIHDRPPLDQRTGPRPEIGRVMSPSVWGKAGQGRAQ